MEHYIVKCEKCGAVIAQCRCPALDKQIKYSICDACLKRQEGEAPVKLD